MTQRLKSHNAFTLIEILVVMTIIALLFAAGYVNFRDFQRRQALTSVGREFVGNLRLAQELALSGSKPDGVSCPVLNGYNFRITDWTYPGFVYTIEADCAGTPVEVKTVTVPGDSSIYIATEPPEIGSPTFSPLVFKTLGQGTNIPAGQSYSYQLRLELTPGTFPYTGILTVIVGAGGDIRVQ